MRCWISGLSFKKSNFIAGAEQSCLDEVAELADKDHIALYSGLIFEDGVP